MGHLHAVDLTGRLRMLYPGESPAAIQQRQYLGKQLENLFVRLNHYDRVNRRSRRKQIERIEQRYRRELLLHYDPSAELTDAFRDGRYNDATAALLYGLALEKYNIPYEGRVDHWESYLIVDPQGKKPVRLNAPAVRPHTPVSERSYRREYLALVRSTLDEDLTTLSPAAADRLYHQYYYAPDQRLNFRELSAYTQFRRAQRAFASRDYPATLAYLTEARLLDERPAFRLYQRAVALQQASLTVPDEETLVKELFVQWREDPGSQYLPARLLRYFDEQQQLLLARGGAEGALDLLNRYCTRAPAHTPQWCAELGMLQSLRLLAYYQARGENVQALHLAESLLNAHPEDLRLQGYVAELTLVNLRQTYPDAQELVDRAKVAARRYPFLLKHDRYADIVLRQTALRVRDLFAAEHETAALLALAHFRKQLTEIPNGYDRTLWTLTAFVAASNYYFAEEDYAPARAYIEEALRYDPANDFLLHQQDLLARY
ncbi:hypothetical protein [Neolewinella sp.]|uniref:hypothetical protein n=1 Tax=Neolewinella sp. TaxID=2993543 RepID=UPI003B516009